MAHTKKLETFYKDVKITLDLFTQNYTIDHQDLSGEYSTMDEAEKAVRDWLRPETPEVKPDVIKVLVNRYGYKNDGGFYEATTRFAEHSRRWGTRMEYWVTKKKTVGAYDKKKEAVEASKIYLDTPENRAVFTLLDDNQQVLNKAERKFFEVSSELKKKLTNAKPKA